MVNDDVGFKRLLCIVRGLQTCLIKNSGDTNLGDKKGIKTDVLVNPVMIQIYILEGELMALSYVIGKTVSFPIYMKVVVGY